jgi:hypothetical protein
MEIQLTLSLPFLSEPELPWQLAGTSPLGGVATAKPRSPSAAPAARTERSEGARRRFSRSRNSQG